MQKIQARRECLFPQQGVSSAGSEGVGVAGPNGHRVVAAQNPLAEPGFQNPPPHQHLASEELRPNLPVDLEQLRRVTSRRAGLGCANHLHKPAPTEPIIMPVLSLSDVFCVAGLALYMGKNIAAAWPGGKNALFFLTMMCQQLSKAAADEGSPCRQEVRSGGFVDACECDYPRDAKKNGVCPDLCVGWSAFDDRRDERDCTFDFGKEVGFPLRDSNCNPPECLPRAEECDPSGFASNALLGNYCTSPNDGAGGLDQQDFTQGKSSESPPSSLRYPGPECLRETVMCNAHYDYKYSANEVGYPQPHLEQELHGSEQESGLLESWGSTFAMGCTAGLVFLMTGLTCCKAYKRYRNRERLSWQLLANSFVDIFTQAPDHCRHCQHCRQGLQPQQRQNQLEMGGFWSGLGDKISNSAEKNHRPVPIGEHNETLHPEYSITIETPVPSKRPIQGIRAQACLNP